MKDDERTVEPQSPAEPPVSHRVRPPDETPVEEGPAPSPRRRRRRVVKKETCVVVDRRASVVVI